jgi:hypothetical protein
MWRLFERLIPIMLLLVLGVALSSVALESGVDAPNHYDGDDDDSGHVEKIFSHDVDVIITVSDPLILPAAPVRWLPAVRPLRPPEIARGPSGSRAPPA